MREASVGEAVAESPRLFTVRMPHVLSSQLRKEKTLAWHSLLPTLSHFSSKQTFFSAQTDGLLALRPAELLLKSQSSVTRSVPLPPDLPNSCCFSKHLGPKLSNIPNVLPQCLPPLNENRAVPLFVSHQGSGSGHGWPFVSFTSALWELLRVCAFILAGFGHSVMTLNVAKPNRTESN